MTPQAAKLVEMIVSKGPEALEPDHRRMAAQVLSGVVKELPKGDPLRGMLAQAALTFLDANSQQTSPLPPESTSPETGSTPPALPPAA